MTAFGNMGFTLIELSIVLIIIGLIIGSVLVGNDMIIAARVRAQISQFEQIATAYNTFKLKYNCIAGDCANATDFLSGTANGNGNNLVENADIICATPELCKDAVNWDFNGEQSHFFEQLSLANMINGKYNSTEGIEVGYPSTKLNYGVGGFAVGRDRGTRVEMPACNGYWQGRLFSYDCLGWGKWQITLFVILNDPTQGYYRAKSRTYGIFTPAQVLSMDTKLDDGLPFTGKFRASNPDTLSTYPNGNCATTNTSSGVYNFTNTDTACHVALKLE